MATAVIIAGSTGTGKTYSIKGLNPESTIIIQVNAEKGFMPWKGSKAMYSTEKKNLFNIDNYSTVIQYLENISEKCPNVHNIVIDDAIYIMRTEFFDRSKEKGYEKYTELATHFRDIIKTIGTLRDDIKVFLMMHIEPVVSDGTIMTYKLSSVGKLLDEKSNPMELVSIALFTSLKFEDGEPVYQFITNAILDKGVMIPAKSPAEMFNDKYIPNDLGLVAKAIEEYYN